MRLLLLTPLLSSPSFLLHPPPSLPPSPLSPSPLSQVMAVGEFSGERVQEAKTKIQQRMVEQGEAVLYQEPERTVISRSGDVCVVALCDQW